MGFALAPAPVASGAGGTQIRERIAAAVGDRDDVVDIGGGLATAPAGPAVAGEHGLPLPSPRSTTRAVKLAGGAAAPGLDQGAAAEARAQHLEPPEHPHRLGLILGPVHGHRERDHRVDPVGRVATPGVGDPGAASSLLRDRGGDVGVEHRVAGMP